MQAKKDLARRIVTDFHGAGAAAKAGEDWAKQFQKDEVPEQLEEVTVELARVRGTASVRIADPLLDPNEGGIAQLVSPDPRNAEILRVDKLLKEAGLAASTSEAGRKIREKAVNINGHAILGPAIFASTKEPLVIRVGKKIHRVVLRSP